MSDSPTQLKRSSQRKDKTMTDAEKAAMEKYPEGDDITINTIHRVAREAFIAGWNARKEKDDD